MSTNLHFWASACVFVDGKALAEERWLQIRRTRAHLFVNISNCVPEEGLEFDAGPFIDTKKVVQMTFFVGTKALTTTGTITQDELRHDVDPTDGGPGARYTFSVEAQLSAWQERTEEQTKMLLDSGFRVSSEHGFGLRVKKAA